MRLRKLAALAMTAVLSLTVLAGCGSDDNKNEIKSGVKKATSISEAYEKAAAMEKYTFSGSIAMNASGDILDDIDEDIKSFICMGDILNLSGSWEGKADTKKNEADVSLGISFGGKPTIEIVNCVVDDGNAYIGVRTMVDGMDKLLSEMSDGQISIKDLIEDALPDGNYLKVSKETLNEIKEMIEDSYGSMQEHSGLTMSSGLSDIMSSDFMNSEEYKKVQETLDYFVQLIITGMKNGSDTCFTNDGDTYKMTINKKNINDILSGILKEVEKNSDAIAEKVNAIAGEKVVTSEQLEQTAALLSAYDLAALMGDNDFSISLYASYVDDTFKTGIAFSFTDGSDTIAVSMENTAKKDDSLEISAPSDVIDDEDAQPFIDEFMKGFKEGINGTSGNLIYDDWDDDWNDDNWNDDDQNDKSLNNNSLSNNTWHHDDESHHEDRHHN